MLPIKKYDGRSKQKCWCYTKFPNRNTSVIFERILVVKEFFG